MNIPGFGLLHTLVRSAVGARSAPAAPRILLVGDQAHIAVRGLQGPAGAAVAPAVERRFAGLPGIRWAAVNTALGHAVVAPDDPTDLVARLPFLTEVAEALEEEYALSGPLPEHPLDVGHIERAALSLALQVAAVPLAVTTRLVRESTLPVGLTSLTSVIDAHPALRRRVTAVVGPRRTGVLLAGLNALAQASSGGFVGLGVDSLRHSLRLAESVAEHHAWEAALPRLTGPADHMRADHEHDLPREVPLHKGPIERYADRAAVVAGAAFAVTLAVTRRPAQAGSAALSAIPKQPWTAREAFGSALGRGLARRGALVADPDALRTLDRIDTVVLDSDSLTTGAYLLTDLAVVDAEHSTGDLAATAYRLFDREDPTRRCEDGDWSLGPLDATGARGGADTDGVAERLRRDGARHVLGLAHGTQLCALVGAAPEMHESAAALVAAARRAELRILVAGGHVGSAALSDAEGEVPGGAQLADSIRQLQRDGTGVLVVSRHRGALSAADAGVGVSEPDGVLPWGADVYVQQDLAEAIAVVAACGAARALAQRGVRLSQASAVLGEAMTLTARRRRTAARSMLAVNAAAAVGMALGVWSATQALRSPSTPAAVPHPWHAMAPDTVLELTDTTPDGLTARQVRGRARAADVATQRPSLLRAVVTETANPLTPVLAGGAALSAGVGAVLDAAIIMGVTLLSGLIGGVQRHAADRAVADLHRRSAVMATVVRDGEERKVPSEELVVGDVVTLVAGDVVPADCRVLAIRGVEADESALTGESLPVAKDLAPVLASDVAERTSMLYAGTTVAAGRARAVVVATGSATEAGRGVGAVRHAAPQVGVERRLAQITRTTMPVALGAAGALMAVGLLRGRPARETVGAGVGLAVASVPEGLPFLVSAAQLAAARRLSAQGVLVRDPRTIEAVGRADVLCFDKTGTLTHGHLALTAVSAGGRQLPLERLEPEHAAVLASGLRATPRRRKRDLAHVTDTAVADGAERAGVHRTKTAKGWRRAAGLPFEPSRGFHATLGHSRKEWVLSVKGAPEEVVKRCAGRAGQPLDRAGREEILAEGEKLAAEGHRVLAVAERRTEEDPLGGAKLVDDTVTGLDFLGFLAFSDEVRGTAAASVQQLADAGVHIVMITGDHPQTAEAIAVELGVVDGRRVITGGELDSLDDRQLDAVLPEVGVVARGTPVHKVRVVEAFQRLGRTVAMTGDGANDAPAIRMADVGIALGGRGTPAARAAADLVVTDDRLETILAVLVEGRAMWASVREALAMLVGGNFGEIAFTVLGATVSGTSPLTARQLLLVNLFTDLLPAIALAVRPVHPEAADRLLREGPEASLGTALTDETAQRATATALGAAIAWVLARCTGRPARARTVALAALVATQLGQTALIGGRDRSVLLSSAGSMAALAAVVQTPGVSHFFGCTPLGPVAWSQALGAATAATAGSLLLPPVVGRVHALVAR